MASPNRYLWYYLYLIKRTIKSIVRINFVLCVWLLIINCARLFVLDVRAVARGDDPPGNPIAPIVLGGIQIALWFTLYKSRNGDARASAALMGAWLYYGLLPVFFWYNDSNFPFTINWLPVYFYLYLGSSHILFALVCRDIYADP